MERYLDKGRNQQRPYGKINPAVATPQKDFTLGGAG